MGATPADRHRTVTNAEIRLNAAAGLLALWVLLYPHPAPLLVGLLIPLPWIALAFQAKANGSANFMLLIFLPALVLPLIEQTAGAGIPTWPTSGWVISLVLPSLVVGLLSARLFDKMMSNPVGAEARQVGSVIWCSIGYSLYAAGVIVLLNGWFDSASPRTFKVSITDKRETVTRSGTTYLERIPHEH